MPLFKNAGFNQVISATDTKQVKKHYPRCSVFHATDRIGMYKIKRHFKNGFIEVAELLDRDGNSVNNYCYADQESKQRFVVHALNI